MGKVAAAHATVVLFSILLLVMHAAGDDPLYQDWTVSFSQRAPLGVHKQVILINNQFPGPLVNVTTDQVLTINVRNHLTEPLLFTWNGVQLRRNSWQDGVEGTNCPILPGHNWTYSFQMKDQIGSFFYFPTLLFQKAAGGYGPIRVNHRVVVPIPYPPPDYEYDILIGDWYNADHAVLRNALDKGQKMPLPDGVLINGLAPEEAIFHFEPGKKYLLRISNVGLKTTLNFRIQNHALRLVETEGSYPVQQQYDDLDIHAGQSLSVLVEALQQHTDRSFYMVAASRFISKQHYGLGIIRYSNFGAIPPVPDFPGPGNYDYQHSLNQARSIRLDLKVGAARPSPQGSFHYGSIPINRTIILENGLALTNGNPRYTINSVSFMHPNTPLKLADYYRINGVFEPGSIPDRPPVVHPVQLKLTPSVIDAYYRDFVQVIFQNPLPTIQTWHLDGYSFFVVGMGDGKWDESKRSSYNLNDAIYRSTVQVYPYSWTAILLELDNYGMWNLRSQDAENRYLGQELYVWVRRPETDPKKVDPRDEAPLPANAIRCGRAAL